MIGSSLSRVPESSGLKPPKGPFTTHAYGRNVICLGSFGHYRPSPKEQCGEPIHFGEHRLCHLFSQSGATFLPWVAEELLK